MKAKKIIALVMVMTMVFAISGVALAVPSPGGSTVVDTSSNVTSISISTVSDSARADLQAAAVEAFGATGTETLLVVDLTVNRAPGATGPVTVSLNVGGVKLGDTIYVVHQKADGSIEIVRATVTADGVVQFTLSSFSPISIIKVAAGAPGPKMPKTGDNTTAVPMVMLLVACVAALAVSGKALKKGV